MINETTKTLKSQELTTRFMSKKDKRELTIIWLAVLIAFAAVAGYVEIIISSNVK
jgi:hypothetical protein